MYWTRSRGIQCKNGDTIPLERTGSLFAVQAGPNTNRIKKREPVRPHTEERTRNTHAVWPVTDASDRADVDMDEPADPDGLGGEVTDTVGRHACWRHRGLQRKLNEKSKMCLTCFIALGVDSVSWEEDWRDVT